jgi:uncharacterized membrane protein
MFFHKESFHVSVSSITRGYLAAGSVAGGIPPDEEKIAHSTVAPGSICCCNRRMSTVNLALLAVGSCSELVCTIAVASEKTKVRMVILMVIPIIGCLVWPCLALFGVAMFVFWILGLVAAVNGKMKPMPMVGLLYQEWSGTSFDWLDVRLSQPTRAGSLF